MDTIRFECKLSRVLSLNESMTPGNIIQAINNQRQSQHLDPLSPNSSISIAAEIQAIQMASTGQFGHVLKNVKYPKPADRMRASGYDFLNAGEVLYAGTDDQDMAVRDWLNSKPHREAILHPDVKEIGAAIKHDKNGRAYACAVVCVPNNKRKQRTKQKTKNVASEIGNRIIDAVEEYGKTAGKKLLIKIAQSDQYKNILQSPIIKKIIKALQD
jgi:hypothetical protein